MSDPRRLLQGRRGELETELLDSVRDDVPPASARARTLRALGIAGAALGTTAVASAAEPAAAATSVAAASATATLAAGSIAGDSIVGGSIAGASSVAAGSATAAAGGAAAKTAGSSAIIVISKWLAVGAGAGILTIALAHPIAAVVETVVQGSAPTSASGRPATRGRAASARPPVVAPVAERASDDHGPIPREAEATPLVSTVSPPSSLTPGGRALRAEEARKTEPSFLSEEVIALDRVRRAMTRDPAEALRLLDLYNQQYPRGHLAPEARVFRIEILAESGQTERAAALAHEVLRTDPSGPHAERIRSLLSEMSEP